MLSQSSETDIVEALRAALEKIAVTAPESEPEYQVWSDTEEAERWGLDQGAWQAGRIARAALARVEKRDAKMEVASDPAAYACAHCGSRNVHGTAWIDLNTGHLLPCDAPTDEIWCDDCAEHTSLDLAPAEEGEQS